MTGSHGLALLAICAALTGCSSGSDDVSSPAQPSCPAPEAGDVAVVADAGPDAVADVAQEAAPGDASPDTAVTVDAAAPGLRIMTFNIKHGDVSSLEDVAAVIRAEEPDLVGLQEVDVDADRSDNVDQAHRLSQLTGMASLFRSALTFSSGGYYGLALLSRFPILSSTKQELTSGSEQRILVVVDVLTDDGVIAVAVTHLGLTASERSEQVAEIVTTLSPQPLAILMGDMNAEPDSPEIQELTAAFADAWEQGGVGAGGTIPVDAPARRIDYIFLGPGWPAATEAHVPGTTASDHLPVVATVPWP